MAGKTVKEYQSTRLKEKATPRTINKGVGFLLDCWVYRADAIRARLRYHITTEAVLTLR